MASLKAEKPTGSQLFGQKKEAVKTGDAATKAPSSKSAAKKPAQKSQEPKRKVNFSYSHFFVGYINMSVKAILCTPRFLLSFILLADGKSCMNWTILFQELDRY